MDAVMDITMIANAARIPLGPSSGKSGGFERNIRFVGNFGRQPASRPLSQNAESYSEAHVFIISAS